MPACGEGDRFFYFTTCGWMMWNWLVSGLASGATLLLYDGSPFHPDGNVLFDFAQAEKMTYLRHLGEIHRRGAQGRPRADRDARPVLACALITSTGSPLSPEGFRFVYEGIKQDVHLASISGGTDIVSCFVLGIPTKPVWIGEIQGPGLGMAVDVWDDDGKPVRRRKGRTRLHQAVPVHAGRVLERSRRREIPAPPISSASTMSGAMAISPNGREHGGIDHPWPLGRDAQSRRRAHRHGRDLQPGRAAARDRRGDLHRPEWDDDVRVVLFVRLAEGVALDEELEKKIRTQIRTGASPRHVPARIVAVADIPRTKSGKITELAVRDVVHGRPVKNKEALANPEALDLFRDLPALRA